MKAIKNAHIIAKDLNIPRGYLVFRENIIKYGSGELPRDKYEMVIDANQAYLFPGFIDIHFHGALGIDSMDLTSEKIKKLKVYQAQTGVTSFLLSTSSASLAKIKSNLEQIRDNMSPNCGASLLGVHLEGPFLNEEKAGAHNIAHLRDYEETIFKDFYDIIKVISYAPEVIDEEIVKLKDYGIKLAVAHTMADYELGKQVLKSCDLITHIFNAMPSIHHRRPSITTAALLSECYIELIADNIHVHPAMYDLLFKLKGDDIILVTDSIAATALGDGEYTLSDQKIIVVNNIAKLKEDNTLAGSTLNLMTALNNFIKQTKVPLTKAIEYVSSNPADFLNLEDRGRIVENLRADLVITDLKQVVKTIVSGEII